MALRSASRLPNAEDEAPVEHVIQHGDVRCSGRRMIVRHVDRAGAEFDLLGRVNKARDEHRARGDVLGLVGGVLTDISLHEAELVGEDEGFAILAQGFSPILA
jgi:hypothetical protein